MLARCGERVKYRLMPSGESFRCQMIDFAGRALLIMGIKLTAHPTGFFQLAKQIVNRRKPYCCPLAHVALFNDLLDVVTMPGFLSQQSQNCQFCISHRSIF